MLIMKNSWRKKFVNIKNHTHNVLLNSSGCKKITGNMIKYLKPGEKFTFSKADKKGLRKNGGVIYGRPLMPSSLPFFTGLLILQAFPTAAFLALFLALLKSVLSELLHSKKKYCNWITMRTNLLNWFNLVSISKNIVFDAFWVVKIY